MISLLELKNAIQNDRIIPFYQPLYDIDSGACTGVEVLARMQDITGNILSPEKFIQLAQQENLLSDLTIGLLRQVKTHITYVKDYIISEFTVAINMPVSLLCSDKFTCACVEMSNEYGINNVKLELELTEHERYQLDIHSKPMESLVDAGIDFVLDDFGTGYSDLICLQQMNLRGLKIPRELLIDIRTNPSTEIIVDSIIDLAKKLGLKITFEGVENKRLFDFIKRKTSGSMQGFYLCPPVMLSGLVSEIIH